MKVYKGKDQDFATLIQSSALLRALEKKGIITMKEVEAEVPGVIKDINQTLMLVQMEKK